MDTVIKRKEAKEKAGQTFEGNLLLQLIADELRNWSNDDLFALYTEFECPVVEHTDMEERDFDRFDNPIELMRFAIGIQVEQLVKTFFADAEHSTVFLETISYIQQNLEDLAEYVNLQLEKDGLQESERTLLGDVIEHLNDAHWNIDIENLEAE
jgi:DNA-directed RNA polymerase specialized sigma54-like protein